MLQYFLEPFKNNKTFKVIATLFALFTVWWVSMYFRGLSEGVENDLFTLSYCILALLGGSAGWIFAKKWGGFKSTLGLAIMMLSFGLLSQFFGQILYNYYIYVLGVEVPYPSIGDIVFFASVIFYIAGSYLLAKVAGIKLSVKSLRGKLVALVIPLAILALTYFFTLQGYEVDWSNKIIVFLDLGFPIGQAIFVSIAIMALMISKDILGGMMRKPIMLLIIALIFQYLADFTFSYQVGTGTWYVGGINDYLYCASYFLMAAALFSIGNMFYKVQES